MKQEQTSPKGCMMGCLTLIIIGLVFFFMVNRCSNEPEASSTIQTEKYERDPMESKAITMAEQIVKVNLHTDSDVDFSEETALSIGDNAYDILGHYTLNGEEHKFDLRLHFKGGEWTAISNWEWSRLQLMRVGQTDLEEDLHGTWASDPGF